MKWIKITERLPEDSYWCLILDPDGNIDVASYEYPNQKNCWESMQSGCCDNYVFPTENNVIYWMPLSEIPLPVGIITFINVNAIMMQDKDMFEFGQGKVLFIPPNAEREKQKHDDWFKRNLDIIEASVSSGWPIPERLCCPCYPCKKDRSDIRSETSHIPVGAAFSFDYEPYKGPTWPLYMLFCVAIPLIIVLVILLLNQ